MAQQVLKEVNNYMNKAARKIIDYCIVNDIGTLIVGYNETFQRNTHYSRIIVPPPTI